MTYFFIPEQTFIGPRWTKKRAGLTERCIQPGDLRWYHLDRTSQKLVSLSANVSGVCIKHICWSLWRIPKLPKTMLCDTSDWPIIIWLTTAVWVSGSIFTTDETRLKTRLKACPLSSIATDHGGSPCVTVLYKRTMVSADSGANARNIGDQDPGSFMFLSPYQFDECWLEISWWSLLSGPELSSQLRSSVAAWLFSKRQGYFQVQEPLSLVLAVSCAVVRARVLEKRIDSTCYVPPQRLKTTASAIASKFSPRQKLTLRSEWTAMGSELLWTSFNVLEIRGLSRRSFRGMLSGHFGIQIQISPTQYCC